MNTDFWSSHSVFFILALVICPRLLLLWFGCVEPQSVKALASFVMVPRMMMASIISSGFETTNGVLVIVLWVLAVPLDLFGILIKAKMTQLSLKAQKEVMENLRWTRTRW